MTDNHLAIYRRVLAIAQSGLTYAKDDFDLERYQELKELSLRLIKSSTDVPISVIQDLIGNDQGYATPKVEVRAFIKEKNKILLVQEHSNHLWSMPGGFADVGYSPSENVIKEVKEETGLKVSVDGLITIQDTDKRPDIPQIAQFYKMIFACTPVNGDFKANIETDQAKFFSLDELPPLSLNRTNPERLEFLMNNKITPLKVD